MKNAQKKIPVRFMLDHGQELTFVHGPYTDARIRTAQSGVRLLTEFVAQLPPEERTRPTRMIEHYLEDELQAAPQVVNALRGTARVDVSLNPILGHDNHILFACYGEDGIAPVAVIEYRFGGGNHAVSCNLLQAPQGHERLGTNEQ